MLHRVTALVPACRGFHLGFSRTRASMVRATVLVLGLVSFVHATEPRLAFMSVSGYNLSWPGIRPICLRTPNGASCPPGSALSPSSLCSEAQKETCSSCGLCNGYYGCSIYYHNRTRQWKSRYDSHLRPRLLAHASCAHASRAARLALPDVRHAGLRIRKAVKKARSQRIALLAAAACASSSK